MPIPWLHWGSRGFFAILDQGFFAGSNFVANLLLARWLSPESYGAFAIGYSVFLLLGTLHTEILSSPMLVFGAGKYVDDFQRYLALVVRGHVWLTAAMSFLSVIGATLCWRFGSAAQAGVLLDVALAIPFVLLLWLARSASYARLQPQWAAAGSGVYLMMLTAALWGLHGTHHVTLFWVWGTMGAASGIVGSLMLLRHRGWPERARGAAPWLEDEPDVPRPVSIAAVIGDHLRYARWSVAAGGLGWLGANVHYFVLSSTVGLANVAAMRVLDTALVPFFQYQSAISRLFVSAFGSLAKRANRGFPVQVLQVAALWGAQALIAYIVVRLFAAQIMLLLYGRTYAQYSTLLGWYGLIIIPEAIIAVILAAFRAQVRTDLVFAYSLLFTAILVTAFLIAGRHGLPGVVFARVVVSFLFVPLMAGATRVTWATPRPSS